MLDFHKVTNLLQTPITVASSGHRWSSPVAGLFRPPMSFFFMGYVCSWCVFLFIPANESRWVEWKLWENVIHCFFVLGKEKRKRKTLFYTMDIVSNRLIQLSNRFWTIFLLLFDFFIISPCLLHIYPRQLTVKPYVY